jgi:hypothetical protein
MTIIAHWVVVHRMVIIRMRFIKHHNIVTSVGNTVMRTPTECVILHFLFSSIMGNPNNL